MSAFIDRVGMVYGRLLVIAFAGKAQNGKLQWLCRCTCGKEVITTANNLASGKTRSCGCFLAESRSKNGTNSHKHGCQPKRLYKIWDGIRQRCLSPTCVLYKHYGGRGIQLCDAWKADFRPFRDWALANGYDEGLTIDRIDNNGNYEPSNCRWVSMSVQENNRNNNRLISYKNQTHTLAEWARILGMNYATLYSRLEKMSFEEAVQMPYKNKPLGWRSELDV